jgi:hypothetical protein
MSGRGGMRIVIYPPRRPALYKRPSHLSGHGHVWFLSRVAGIARRRSRARAAPAVHRRRGLGGNTVFFPAAPRLAPYLTDTAGSSHFSFRVTWPHLCAIAG